MSGELRAPADWVPPGPVAEKHYVKEEKLPPTTVRGMIVRGSGRFLVALGASAAATAGIALLIVWLADADAARVLPLSFYLGGAGVAAGGALLSTGGSADWMPETGFDRQERESWISSSLVYFAIGIPLVGIGFLLDSLLG